MFAGGLAEMIERNLDGLGVALQSRQQRHQHLRRSGPGFRWIARAHFGEKVFDICFDIISGQRAEISGVVDVDVFERRIGFVFELRGEMLAVFA